MLSGQDARRFLLTLRLRTDSDRRSPPGSASDVETGINDFWNDEVREVDGDLRTSMIVDPRSGRLTPRASSGPPPAAGPQPLRNLFSSAAASRGAGRLPAGPEELGLSERCLQGFNAGPPMVPDVYNNNLRVVQTRNYVVLVTEMIHDARIVPLDGQARIAPEVTSWSGESRGRWEGGTLVVETIGFDDRKAAFQMPRDPGLPGRAIGRGSDLKLVERFTPIAEDQLRYEFTVDAPASFERPFTAALTMFRSDGRMYEYACHEGNYSMTGILRGARSEEALSR